MVACAFKNLFGAPRTGLHSIRLFDIAVVDVVATVLLGVLLAKWTGANPYLMCVALLLASVPIHRFFCVKTTLARE